MVDGGDKGWWWRQWLMVVTMVDGGDNGWWWRQRLMVETKVNGGDKVDGEDNGWWWWQRLVWHTPVSPASQKIANNRWHSRGLWWWWSWTARVMCNGGEMVHQWLWTDLLVPVLPVYGAVRVTKRMLRRSESVMHHTVPPSPLCSHQSHRAETLVARSPR